MQGQQLASSPAQFAGNALFNNSEYAILAPGDVSPDALDEVADEDLVLALPQSMMAHLVDNPRCAIRSGDDTILKVRVMGGVVRWIGKEGGMQVLGEGDNPMPAAAIRAMQSSGGLLTVFVDDETGNFLSPAIMKL